MLRLLTEYDSLNLIAELYKDVNCQTVCLNAPFGGTTPDAVYLDYVRAIFCVTFQGTNHLRGSWLSALPRTGRAEGKGTDGDPARISSSSSSPPLPSSSSSSAESAQPDLPARDLEDRAVHQFVFWPGHGVCCREMAGILAWFWNERFWLPHNVTWADLKNTDEATFPQAEDLYLACPLAFCIFMIRLIFERWVWAHAFGVAVDRVYVGGWCSTARCPRFSLSSLNNGILSGQPSVHLLVLSPQACPHFMCLSRRIERRQLSKLFIYISAEQCAFSWPTLLWFWFYFLFFLKLCCLVITGCSLLYHHI